jgi:hypothetical protein
MPTLDDILFAIQHPLQSASGTANEFMNSIRSAYNNAQMQRMLQAPAPPVQAPTMPTVAPVVPVKPKKQKKLFTPEEELKQTTQAGQLAVLNQPVIPQ